MLFEEFNNWYQSFLDRHEGFSPACVSLWFKNIDRLHKGIRGVLGGDIIHKSVSLDSFQTPASGNEYEALIKEILNIIPYYLQTYGFKEFVFANPTIQLNEHNCIKTSKHVLSYAAGSVGGSSYKTLESLISKLGVIWSKNVTSNIKLIVTFSITPKAFVLLGHYGPDITSCFKQNGAHETDKYILAQSQDSFICTVADEGGRNIARVIGYYNFNTDHVFHFINLYLGKSAQDGNIMSAICKALEDIVGRKAFPSVNIVGKTGIFKNVYGNFSFGFNKECLRSLFVLNPCTEIIRRCECVVCSVDMAELGRSPGEVFLVDDDRIVCKNCYKNLPECEISGVRTFGHIGSVYNRYGEESRACQKILDDAKYCTQCGNFSAFTDNVDGHIYCLSCLDDMDKCEICGKLFVIDDLNEKDDITYCKLCSGFFGDPNEQSDNARPNALVPNDAEGDA